MDSSADRLRSNAAPWQLPLRLFRRRGRRIAAPLLGLAALGGGILHAQNAATWVRVEADVNRHPINPNIYGVAYADAHDIAALNTPLNRWGGNATTRYNWQLDAHSAAADWYFETYSDGNGTPSGSADAFVTATRAAQNGAEPLFTIPLIDYLANLGPGRSTLKGFSVTKYGAQQKTDPYNSDAGNGLRLSDGSKITGNNPLDTGTANSTAIQQAWIQHFITTYGASATANGIKYYILDNEPSLWNSTHRDVHPAPPTYDEVFSKIVAYAGMIRTADPNAKIVGPEEWGWWAMYFSGLDQANGNSSASSDYRTHANTYYYPWLLQQLAAHRQQTGQQLIDVFTVHGYNGAPDGSDDSATGQQLRNKETRILWDPKYSDPSWYGDIGINGRVINWIPTLKAMVAQYCPGLQIGFTEYNWGDEANLNGATTQADVLGIYGREGLDLATRWTVAKDTSKTPTVYYVTYLASQIYRNYDGQNSTFGDTSVAATVANPDNVSAFAATRASDGALTVMVINKQTGSTPVTVSLGSFNSSGTAQAWQINSAAQTSIARLADVSVSGGAFTTTVPSQSVTLFVLPAGTPPAQSASASLVNISTRAYCTTGDGVTIGGFVVGGSAPKQVLLRAVGPSLTAQGLGANEVLADPTLEVHDALHGNAIIATNDNWGDNSQGATITTVSAQVGATPLQPGDTTSSALVTTLQPGVYSFVVRGQNGSSGIVLIESYDADAAPTTAHFVNISSRAYCTTGNGVAIGGFVIGGNKPKRILLRGVGPTLSTQGIPTSEILTDPSIELHDVAQGNAVIDANDNWGDNANASDIVATAARIGATPFAQGDTTSSALLVTLSPGVYSFVARGASAAPSGIVLIEVYDAD